MRGAKAKLVKVSGIFRGVLFVFRVWIMIGNLSELAAMAGMPSEPTVKKMIDENSDFPILSRGKNGVGYEFDLVKAATFIRDLKLREEEQARARSEEVRQLGLSLLGDDAAALGANRAGLSSADRRALMEEELVAIKLAERRGALIRKDEYVSALGQLAAAFKQRFLDLPDRVSKRITLNREQQAMMQRMVEADLGFVADELEKLNHAAPTDHGDPAVRHGGAGAAGDSEPDPAEAPDVRHGLCAGASLL